MEPLDRIKRLILHDRVIFTIKARTEMDVDGITDDDVIEAIMNATRIEKTLRSTIELRTARREILYVIKGMTFGGLLLYTKGTIRKSQDTEALYILISSKRAD